MESSFTSSIVNSENEQIVKRQRMKARERMQKDLEVYSRDQIKKIEELYQVANQKWQSQEAKDNLKQLIKEYDRANRTGCALLYLGQMSVGKEKEKYLQNAINDFSDCYYGDGVQVGAYARFHLALFYNKNGQDEKAEKLFEEINNQYPEAIDHKGNLLIDIIKK